MDKILLIEDEPNIVEAIRFLLTRDGWNVQTHNDGGDAQAMIERHKPDILVLDVMLPNKSGFDILRDLRASTAYGDLPVLMLTARGQAKDRDMAMAAGADAYMSKPFSNAEVVEQINQLAQRGA